jgi:hypothetical protein
MRDRLILVFAALTAFGASLGSTFDFDDYAICRSFHRGARRVVGIWRPIQTRP